MHEMMLADAVQGGGVTGTLSFQVLPKVTDSTIPFVFKNITGRVIFDIPGQQDLSISAESSRTVTVPADATQLHFEISKINPQDTAFVQTANNAVVTGVNSWGIDNGIVVRLESSTALVVVPAVSPPWSDWTSMFKGCSSFNQNIGMWDTSHVVSMYSMFMYATKFNQPLNSWNTEKVTDTVFLFAFCSAFNQSISNWNVGNITIMNQMFRDCTTFNQNLSNLKFPKVPSSNRINYASATPSWLPQNKPTFTMS